jgi:hypothetical protein
VRSNQIKDCPVTIDDVEVASKIWGKNIAALKGKTTRSKSIPVATDLVRVPTELLRLHKLNLTQRLIEYYLARDNLLFPLRV